MARTLKYFWYRKDLAPALCWLPAEAMQMDMDTENKLSSFCVFHCKMHLPCFIPVTPWMHFFLDELFNYTNEPFWLLWISFWLVHHTVSATGRCKLCSGDTQCSISTQPSHSITFALMQKIQIKSIFFFWLSGIRDSPQSIVRFAQHPGDMRLDIKYYSFHARTAHPGGCFSCLT